MREEDVTSRAKQRVRSSEHLIDGQSCQEHGTTAKSNSNGSCQKWGVKCHFATLNSVLAPMNNVFAPMVGIKMGCHFNNLIFLLKNIIKLAKYGMKYSR